MKNPGVGFVSFLVGSSFQSYSPTHLFPRLLRGDPLGRYPRDCEERIETSQCPPRTSVYTWDNAMLLTCGGTVGSNTYGEAFYPCQVFGLAVSVLVGSSSMPTATGYPTIGMTFAASAAANVATGDTAAYGQATNPGVSTQTASQSGPGSTSASLSQGQEYSVSGGSLVFTYTGDGIWTGTAPSFFAGSWSVSAYTVGSSATTGYAQSTVQSNGFLGDGSGIKINVGLG